MREHLPNLTSAILVGGKSSRFGEPKAFAKLDNQTLLEIALAVGRSLSRNNMLVGNIKNRHNDINVPCHADVFPGCGPLAGIHTALLNSPTNWIAIIPCDMPLLSPAVYQFLYKFRSEVKPVVAVSASGLEPLVSIWPKVCLTEISQLLSDKIYHVKTCLERMNAGEIYLSGSMPEFRQLMFSNVNYKSDLSEIIKQVSGNLAHTNNRATF